MAAARAMPHFPAFGELPARAGIAASGQLGGIREFSLQPFPSRLDTF